MKEQYPYIRVGSLVTLYDNDDRLFVVVKGGRHDVRLSFTGSPMTPIWHSTDFVRVVSPAVTPSGS